MLKPNLGILYLHISLYALHVRYLLYTMCGFYVIYLLHVMHAPYVMCALGVLCAFYVNPGTCNAVLSAVYLECNAALFPWRPWNGTCTVGVAQMGGQRRMLR